MGLRHPRHDETALHIQPRCIRRHFRQRVGRACKANLFAFDPKRAIFDHRFIDPLKQAGVFDQLVPRRHVQILNYS